MHVRRHGSNVSEGLAQSTYVHTLLLCFGALRAHTMRDNERLTIKEISQQNVILQA